MTTVPAPASASEAGAATGIASRPSVDPVVLALLSSAVDQVWPRPRVVAAEVQDKPPAWRFSGRWWSRPVPTRRVRPWA